MRIVEVERHGASRDVPAAGFPLSHVVMGDGSIRVVATMMVSRFGFAGYDDQNNLVIKGSLASDWPQPEPRNQSASV